MTHEENQAKLSTEELRRTYRLLVQTICPGALTPEPYSQGHIRNVVRFRQGNAPAPFGFIVNEAHLTFYYRTPLLKFDSGLAPSLVRELPGSFINTRNEVQVQIRDRATAERVIEIANREASRLLGIRVAGGTRTPPPTTPPKPSSRSRREQEEFVEKTLAGERLLFMRNREAARLARKLADGVCAACKINVRLLYGTDVIEAHHRTAFAALDERTTITADDLIGLCPSCHRALHRLSPNPREPMSVEDFRLVSVDRVLTRWPSDSSLASAD